MATISSKDARISWNVELREVLIELVSDTTLSTASKALVFQEICKDHLGQCGNPKVTWAKLRSQFQDLRLAAKQHLWPPEQATRQDSLRSKIHDAAVQLGLSDATRENGSIQTAPSTPSNRSGAVSSYRVMVPGTRGLATPPSSSRKRQPPPLAVEDNFTTPKRSPAKKVRVAVAVDPQLQPPGRTKIALKAASRTIRHRLERDKVLLVSPAQLHEIQQDLVYPCDQLAHPEITGLLYRIWDDNCQSPLQENGFVSAGTNCMLAVPSDPPPTAQAPRWKEMAIHFQRVEVATPFVSCSSNFCWVLRNAMKKFRKNKPDIRISIIDPTAIDRRKIFHADPFHKALCVKKPFYEGAFYYHGTWEYLVYDRIPAEAVMKTIKMSDIIQLTNTHLAVNELLCLDEISTHMKSYLNKILPELRLKRVKLTTEVILSMADICNALGLHSKSPPGFLSGVVTDICFGWGLLIEKHEDAEWSEKSWTFAQAICARGNARPEDFAHVMYAFLDGVRWAKTRHNNAKFNADKVRKLDKGAAKVGLASPARLVAAVFDGPARSVMSTEKRQRQALPGPVRAGSSRNRALLWESNMHERHGYRRGEEEETRPSRATRLRTNDGSDGQDDDEYEVQDEEEEGGVKIVVVGSRVEDDDEDLDRSVYEI